MFRSFGVVITIWLMCLVPSVHAAPRVKLATLAPKGTSFHQVLLAMGEKWRNAPGGGVVLSIYTDGTMGGEADMVRRMRAGQLQAAMLTVTGLTEIDSSVAGLQNIPMVYRSLDEVEYVREQLRGEVEQKFREKGFVVLFWGDTGWVRFFTRKAAVMPDDLRKLKLFTWSGDNQAVDLWKAAGFNPVPLEMTDILTGLQTGLIDAVATAPNYALASQLYSIAPHMLDLRWAPLTGATVMNKKTWDSLSPETQAAMLEAAKEAGKQIQARARAENDEAIDAMKQRGLTVHPAPADVEDVWRRLAENAYPKVRGSIVPADMFDHVIQLLKDYRATHPSSQP